MHYIYLVFCSNLSTGHGKKAKRFHNFYSLFFLQTPIFSEQEKDSFDSVKELIYQLLGSNAFLLSILGIIILVGLIILYSRKKSIPELEAQIIKDDTWFVNRDDNRRVGIVVSVNLRNRSTSGIYIKDCKLSGYSPREYLEEISLDSLDGDQKQKISFPMHKHFHKGLDLYIGPYSSENLWFYYESRSMTMSNLIETPLYIKDSRKKRKSIRVSIPRHTTQAEIYQKMAEIW